MLATAVWAKPAWIKDHKGEDLNIQNPIVMKQDKPMLINLLDVVLTGSYPILCTRMLHILRIMVMIAH